MESDLINSFADIATQIDSFFSGSYFVLALKFFLFVYVTVLFIDIVMLFILRGVSVDVKKILYGAERPLMPRGKLIHRWEAILARVESGNESQYKVAVLEADTLADEILDGIGFRGVNMAEKLEKVQGAQLETKEHLAEAHAVRNRIIQEPDFSLTREMVEKCLESYKKFFDELELFTG